ncbi:CD1871A family CXXC motif-containing protein [Oscillibacter sp.]|uniref:CD1871A family CXXC motif-containing protein n=1 Tax=Oscillibacter sp. TaxID=1945593 RepID=UPI00289F865A|nr:CD1871A family CXXC motif-containing protein [Oscillibacter sp.]
MTAKDAPRPHRRLTGKHLVTAAIFVVSVGLIAVGISVGEPAEVLQKAVNICLECIGIG